MLEERYEEFRGQVRDPYPAIGQKAVGSWGRIVSMVSISLTLYGGGCVFIVLISQLVGSLAESADLHLSLCVWMVIVSALLIPLTWLGTPKDFWWIAVGALVSTMVACLLIVINCIRTGLEIQPKTFPTPTVQGSFKGFSSFRKFTNYQLILLFSFLFYYVRLCWSLNIPDHSG